MNLLDMMFKGGVIMWPILGCSLVGAYVVIERVADLPRELPRIYQRLVRAA